MYSAFFNDSEGCSNLEIKDPVDRMIHTERSRGGFK